MGNGETCIIVCNGKSLENVKLEFLNSLPTYGLNRIHKMYPDFCPTYYVASGYRCFESDVQVAEHLPMILDDRLREAWVPEEICGKFPFPHVLPIHKPHPHPHNLAPASRFTPVFSYNPLQSFGHGYTVTYNALQLAFWHGFRTVIMVGLDHDYGSSDRHWYLDSPMWPIHIRNDRLNAAIKDKVTKAYRKASATFEKDGRYILNVTPNSGTGVFQKVFINGTYASNE